MEFLKGLLTGGKYFPATIEMSGFQLNFNICQAGAAESVPPWGLPPTSIARKISTKRKLRVPEETGGVLDKT